jgi:hypothetical protein
MNEAEHLRVQRLSPERIGDRTEPRLANGSSIQRISQHGRPARFRHVDADLVRSPRLQRAAHERRRASREPLDDLDVRDRAFAGLHARRVAQPVRRMTPVHRRDRPCLRRADGQREVAPLDVVRSEESLQSLARRLVLRDDHHAGRVLVQAMHDPRPQMRAVCPIVRVRVEATSREQPVHERPVRVPTRWVNDEPRRLVEHEEVRVLEQHRERHRRIRQRRRQERVLRRHVDALPLRHLLRRARERAVDQDAPVLDPPLDHPARHHVFRTLPRERGGDHLVESLAHVARGRGERELRRLGITHQILDFTWPFDLIKMSMSARS